MAETIELIGLSFLPLFLALDFVVRRQRFATPRWWRLRAIAVTLASLMLSIAVAMIWKALIGDHSVFELQSLGIAGGALVGILVSELVYYWYHRTVHRSNRLFRWVHQMHHSAESMDAFSAYYLHPLDVLGFSTVGSLVFFPLLGLSLEAGAIASAFVTFNSTFQHANVRTPRWLGYIVQRPESHCVHHERGHHACNYSDLPLLDMLFGTFRNPPSWNGKVGYHDGASTRIGEMLVGRDVTRPRAARKTAALPELLPVASSRSAPVAKPGLLRSQATPGEAGAARRARA